MQNSEKLKKQALSAYLVISARAGDRQAVDGLVRLHGPRIQAHATRLLSEADGARDCVQEAWIEIMHGLHGLRDENAFLPWALRIVTRRVAREISKRQRSRSLRDELTVEIATTCPDKGLDFLAANDVRRAIRALSPEQQACVALFYREDLRVAEVAVALDVPVGTVKTRLMHARQKLRAILEGESDGQAGQTD